MKKNLNILLVIVALGMIYAGFRLVTQAVQGLNVTQNDGYAVSGGMLILAGGLSIGRVTREFYGKKGGN